MGFPAIWMNGRITDPADARVSIFDHGLLYGDGVFEGIRFYAGRCFRLEAHLARLERSAAAIELDLPYSRDELRAAIDAVVVRAGAPDGYLRLVVTRGEGDLGLDPRSCGRPTTIVAAAPLRVFDRAEAGVTVIVASIRQAPADVVDPRIKSLNYLNRLLARLEAARAGADEAFMLNARGHLAEGTTDNVFLVREGELLTPPASDGALEGITRAAVVALAKELGIPAREASLGTYDLRAADEAFLVGTGAGLVAIRSIDGRAVPDCPGPVFERIRAAFDALVRREVAPRPPKGS
jgi:branched-chain amino acid aminotransferase